jgi:HK97 gp10 family phage protein
MANKVTLTGIDEMKKQLAALGYAVQNQIAHGAMLDAAKLLKAEVIRRAPVKTGNLRDNIIIKRDPAMPGQAGYAVLVRKVKVSRKNRRLINKLHAGGITVVFSNDPFYWRFVEFGHKIMRGKRVFGEVAAQPFFRPAIDAVKGQFIATVGEGIQSRVNAFLAKGA